ncbi:MAG: peptidylprolyl isomerase [Rickettsiales bacterium]|jgi:peptidyl-prolyl cis-trans isomerase C|nr:peptidylprolyl isomerase [Rickettsiales bacterium]
MKTKKTLLAFWGCCVAILLAVICLFVVKNIKNRTLSEDTILATSDYGNVTMGDVRSYLENLETFFKKSFEFDKLTREEQEIVIKEVVNERILVKKAKKTDITSSKQYVDKMNAISNNLLKELFLERLINENVTEEKIKEKYNDLTKFLNGKKEYRVKHIVVKTETEIKKVVAELRLKSNTFEKLAEKYSIDASKDSGGDLGYIVEGQTVGEFEEVIKNQPLNRMTKPFQTSFGWHVAIKEDERDAVVPTFDDVRDSLKMSLVAEFVKKYSQDNLKDSNIQFR